MPYCTNCGRKLDDGEVCNCTASAQGAPVQQTPSPQPIPPQQGFGQQPYGGYPQNGQPYPNQPSPYQPNYQFAYDGQALPPPPKQSSKWILAIIIPFVVVTLVLMGIFLAIFVPSLSRYKEKSKQTSINNKASSIYRGANSSLVDLDSDDVDTKGDYIISSDSSKSIAVPYDVEKFYEKEKRYFDKVDELEYFIVIRDGHAVYSAAAESWNDKKTYIGTYPAEYTGSVVAYSPLKYSPKGEKEHIEKNDTLNEIYNDAVEKFKDDIKKQNYKEW